MRIRLSIAVLFLLQRKEVVGSDSLDNVTSTWNVFRFDDSGNTDLIFLNQS